jgi:chromatin remodeling complex protein RSC6
MSLETIQNELTALRTEVKAVSRMLRRIKTKLDDPDGSKAKERSATNGFNRPQHVTEPLRAFLGLAEGEMISRSQVTQRITSYIKENGLKHPDNGRLLILDAKLKELLQVPDGTQVTYLNLQRFLSPLYIKAEKEPKA